MKKERGQEKAQAEEQEGEGEGDGVTALSLWLGSAQCCLRLTWLVCEHCYAHVTTPVRLSQARLRFAPSLGLGDVAQGRSSQARQEWARHSPTKHLLQRGQISARHAESMLFGLAWLGSESSNLHVCLRVLVVNMFTAIARPTQAKTLEGYTYKCTFTHIRTRVANTLAPAYAHHVQTHAWTQPPTQTPTHPLAHASAPLHVHTQVEALSKKIAITKEIQTVAIRPLT